jgi:uncharacterized protein (DUF433 family)
MALDVAAEAVPIQTDRDGVARVGGTRVTLDTIVAAFDEGATAEEIVGQYPSLNRADVYAVIAYCIRHRSDVDAYLRQRQRRAAAVRAENESRFDPRGVRARLMRRRDS